MFIILIRDQEITPLMIGKQIKIKLYNCHHIFFLYFMFVHCLPYLHMNSTPMKIFSNTYFNVLIIIINNYIQFN